jgi:hypothetical protein
MMAALGQRTKSLRSSPLRGGKSRRARSLSREGNTVNKHYRRATHYQKQRHHLRASTPMARAVDPTP